MDFLRTLLAYMAATFVVAVESTATPSVTPVPTPAPAATGPVYTIMETLEPAATPSPEPTVSVTPVPVPTITANIRGYHNLLMGDRGDEVRKLQERLIELGYLPEGAADGAFGGQTRTAVRRFQYYNGLTVDGIAGRTTQTNLFENPDAAPMPTPEPTAEPTPTAEPASKITPLENNNAADLADAAEPSDGTETEAVSDDEKAEEESDEGAGENVYEEREEAKALTEIQTAETSEEVTVTPYLVATPTQIPWGDETPAPTAMEAELEEEEDTAEETDAPEKEEDKADATATTRPESETAETTEVKEDIETQPAVESEADTAEITPLGEIVEEVNLDEPEPTATPEPEAERAVFNDLAGWVILNDGEEALQWTLEEEGTQTVHSPRMQAAEGDDIRLSLDDLAMSIESWELSEETGSIILQIQGYTLALLDEENGFVATVDGIEVPTEADDFSFGEGHFIRVSFLCRALDGNWEWDAEEETLLLRIPEKMAKLTP